MNRFTRMAVLSSPVALVFLASQFSNMLLLAQSANFHNAPASVKFTKNPYQGQQPDAVKSVYQSRCAAYQTRVRTSQQDAERRDNPVFSLGFALFWAPELFLWAGDLQNAEAYYRNSLRDVSSYAYYEALVGLGNVAARRGQRDQAQDFYERAVVRNPYRVIAFHNLASLFLGSDAEKLRSVVERGLLFNPHDPELAQLHNN